MPAKTNQQLDAILAARSTFISEAMEHCEPSDYGCEDWGQFIVVVRGLTPQIPCGACDACSEEVCCQELDSVEFRIWDDLCLFVEHSA